MNKFFSFLGLTRRSGNLVEGYSKYDGQRNRKSIFLSIMSSDASSSTKKKFINHCIVKDTKFIEDFSKEELGTSIGRKEVKILATADENIAKKLYTLYEEEKVKT